VYSDPFLLWLCCQSLESSSYGDPFCYGYMVSHSEPSALIPLLSLCIPYGVAVIEKW